MPRRGCSITGIVTTKLCWGDSAGGIRSSTLRSHLYTYAGNNPLRWTHSHGLFHGGIGFLGELPGYSPGSTWNPEGDLDKSGGNQEDMTATAITGAFIVSAGAGGIAGVGSEAVDTVIEVGLGVSLPMSPADALQDLGKSLLRGMHVSAVHGRAL